MPYSKASFDKMRAKKREEKIEEIRESAKAAYDEFMELKNKLYELDELEGDKLTEWVDQHEG